MGFTSLTVPVPGGEIFATRRGEGEGHGPCCSMAARASGPSTSSASSRSSTA